MGHVRIDGGREGRDLGCCWSVVARRSVSVGRPRCCWLRAASRFLLSSRLEAGYVVSESVGIVCLVAAAKEARGGPLPFLSLQPWSLLFSQPSFFFSGELAGGLGLTCLSPLPSATFFSATAPLSLPLSPLLLLLLSPRTIAHDASGLVALSLSSSLLRCLAAAFAVEES